MKRLPRLCLAVQAAKAEAHYQMQVAAIRERRQEALG